MAFSFFFALKFSSFILDFCHEPSSQSSAAIFSRSGSISCHEEKFFEVEAGLSSGPSIPTSSSSLSESSPMSSISMPSSTFLVSLVLAEAGTSVSAITWSGKLSSSHGNKSSLSSTRIGMSLSSSSIVVGCIGGAVANSSTSCSLTNSLNLCAAAASSSVGIILILKSFAKVSAISLIVDVLDSGSYTPS